MPPGRNEACPCGSGRKYKHCCGSSPAAAPAVLQSRPPAEAEIECERLLALGQTLEDHGLLDRAVESFGRATALRPQFAEAHNDLGQVLLRLGRTDAAIASCQRALALRPRFAAAIGNLANAERARGAIAAAIAGYRRVIALEPGLAEAHRNLGVRFSRPASATRRSSACERRLSCARTLRAPSRSSRAR